MRMVIHNIYDICRTDICFYFLYTLYFGNMICKIGLWHKHPIHSKKIHDLGI